MISRKYFLSAASVAAGLAAGTLATSSVNLAATGGDGTQPAVERRQPAAEAGSEAAQPLRVAQALTLQVQPALSTTVGAAVRLPISVRGATPGTRARVMLHQVPRWLSLSKGESVGAGVWLLSIADAETLTGQIGEGASGAQRIGVSIVGADGRIAAETFLTLNVAAQQAAAPASGSAVGSSGAIPDWQAVLNRQQGVAPAAGAQKEAAPVQVAQAARAAAAATPAVDEAKLVAEARHLVRECTTCHSLYGYDDGIPLMIGLSRDRFIETMQMYRSGKRDHAAMKSVVDTLSEEQTLALALYLGRIRPPAPPEPGETRRAAAPSTLSQPIAPAKRTKPEAPERIARWIQRGEQLLGAGDVAQARLLLERAAEHGNSRAAVLMGTSYDPNTLPWRPDLGLTAEPARAREWYVYAQQLGAGNDAAERLAELPSR